MALQAHDEAAEVSFCLYRQKNEGTIKRPPQGPLVHASAAAAVIAAAAAVVVAAVSAAAAENDENQNEPEQVIAVAVVVAEHILILSPRGRFTSLTSFARKWMPAHFSDGSAKRRLIADASSYAVRKAGVP